MGLFNLNKKSATISIENGYYCDGKNRFKLSNCLIAGTKNMGRDGLLKHLIADSLNSGKSVFVIQNGTSLPNNTIRNEFSLGWGNRQFFSIDFGHYGFTQPINLFKGSSPDFVQELILKLMETYKSISQDTKSFTERYLTEVMDLYTINPTGKRFSLENIRHFDYNWIQSEANRLYTNNLIDSYTRDKYINYANNLVLYKKEYFEYENFCIDIQKQNFAKLLSGNMSYRNLNTPQYINFINMDYISCSKQSTSFIQLFIHKAIQEMQNNRNMETTFVFEDIDVTLVPEFKELLRACQSTNNNCVYFTMDKILDNKLDFDPRAFCNAYFIFNQRVMSEAEEWAKTSGTYKKEKVSYNYGQYDQVYGPQNRGFVGEMYTFFNRNKKVITGTNVDPEYNEYYILPEELMKLPDTSAKVLIKTMSGGAPYVLEVRWA